MRTTKPISTISFNTRDYLVGKLNELVKSGIITTWHAIEHQPEDDEGGTKIHFHVWIEPSKMIQTNDLRDQLREYDPTHPDKPLGCLPFQSSRFDPWYMYAIHDSRYLASKGQSRKYHYSYDDVMTSDPDQLNYQVRQIDLMSLSPYADMEDAITHGVSWQEYFSRGTIPIPQVSLYEKAWFLLVDNANRKLDRNGTSGHQNEYIEDPDTVVENGNLIDANSGEVIFIEGE